MNDGSASEAFALHGRAWSGTAAEARPALASEGLARRGSNGEARLGSAGLGAPWCGEARQHRQGWSAHGWARYGGAWQHRLGAAHHGGVWSDQPRLGKARQADIHVRVVDARDLSPIGAVRGPDRDPRNGSLIQLRSKCR